MDNITTTTTATMEAFCDSPLWDEEEYSNSTGPILTECFESTVMVYVPCGYLFLVTPIYFYSLASSERREIAQSWLNIAKTVLCCALMLLCLAGESFLVHKYTQGEPLDAALLLSPAMHFLAMLLATILIQLGRQKGVRSTGVLFVYWLVQTVAAVFIISSQSLKYTRGLKRDSFFLIWISLFGAFAVIQLILSALVDRPPTNQKDSDPNACPEGSTSFLSEVTFSWFTSLIIRGYRHSLERSDLWSLNPEYRAHIGAQRFEKQWTKEVRKRQKSRQSSSHKTHDEPPGGRMSIKPEIEQSDKKAKQPQLTLALIKAFGAPFALAGGLKMIQNALMFVSPILLKLLIQYTTNQGIAGWKGYMYAVLLFVVASLQSIAMQQYFHRCLIVGMHIRSAMISVVYKKAMRLTSASRRTSTVGEIVNLMAVDAQRFVELITFLHMIWSAPAQLCVCMYLLWMTLGPSILAGVAVMVLLIPVNGLIAKRIKTLQESQMINKDERIKITSELLNGIKVLKLYAWESSFKEKVLGFRQKELAVLKKAAYLRAVQFFSFSTAPFLVCLVTFATYLMSSSDNVLDAEKAFVSLSLFNLMRFPLTTMPIAISNMIMTKVSINRLQNFLALDELDPNNVDRVSSTESSVCIKEGRFTWDEKDELPTLSRIDLQVPPGSLCAVVGTVGCGKSSLISAILGEMHKQRGEVRVKGSIAYVAQQAWIQNATLMDNILFSRPKKDSLYSQVLEACALNSDLQILPDADLTEIGEQGINLSGGQKQRVSLARAVYADADVYLLDDPLSAVDSHVGKHIFEKVLGPKGMLQKKTRVLVTHGVTFLPQVDQIVVLVDGRVSEVGTYKQLLDKDGAFAEFLRTYQTNETNHHEEQADWDEFAVKKSILANVGNLDKASLIRSTSSKDRPNSKADEAKINGILAQKGKQCDNLIQEETSKTGVVQLSVLLAYIKAVGVPLCAVIILFYALYDGCQIGANFWLSDWSNDAPLNGTVDPSQRDLRLGVFTLLGLSQCVVVYIGSFLLAYGSMLASACLHETVLTGILRSPMSFFDTTPLGRILNRFSKDIDIIDTMLPSHLTLWMQCVSEVVATLVVISVSTPIFIVVVLPLGLIYYFIQRFYIATTRQLKRLESVSQSPVFSYFGETLQGTSTIRAYGYQGIFTAESEARVTESIACYYPGIVSQRWIAIYLNFMGNCVVFFAALFAVLGRDYISAGIVGLSVSYALKITSMLAWSMRVTSDLETSIVAVERVKEYSELESEADWVVEDSRPPADWPARGEMQLQGYGTRYRDNLDLVLQDITCHFSPGEKIGIVGRTGSGKSSLALGLFRILEPCMGTITIDGVDIASIGLHDLRSKLTIIPQDPVVFSGTLRFNLDPFEKNTDEELWTALELAHLKDFVASLAEGLMHECTEGGENLSVGQKQLLCLARALLRKTRILILDEATAAVDLETDDLIQSTIRTEFNECTVLTIAHRLNTIMDYDRVLVLERGHIAEFDQPQALLKDKGSKFYTLANAAGLTSKD